MNTGTLTVNPAALTITASPQSTTYGTALNLGTTAFTTSGTQNGETVTAVTLTSNGSATVAGTLAAGTYSTSPNDITPSAATGTGGFLASNYNITYTSGTLTVNPAASTITASLVNTMVDGVSISDALSRAQYGILAGEQVGSYLTDQCGLPRRQFTGCQSQQLEFPGRKPTNANLANANLSNSNFQGAILQNAIVTGAIFTGSYFAGTNFRGTGYSASNLPPGLANTAPPYTVPSANGLSNTPVPTPNKSFANDNISGLNFNGGKLASDNFHNANAQGDPFVGANLKGAIF